MFWPLKFYHQRGCIQRDTDTADSVECMRV